MQDTIAEWTKLRELEPGVQFHVIGRVAYLEGSVYCYRRKKQLAQLLTKLPSVEKVVNRLRVVPAPPQLDRSIREAALAALTADPSLRLGSLSVTVVDGVVEMRGTAPSVSARITAEEAAWSVCGVRHVNNRLEAWPPAGAEPADVGRQLQWGLVAALGPRAESVRPEFDGGTVYLRGDIASAEDRLAAEDCVRWYPMVRRVVNDLSVLDEQPLSSLRQSA